MCLSRVAAASAAAFKEMKQRRFRCLSGWSLNANEPSDVCALQWLPSAVVESVHKLDVIIGSKASYKEVFKPENISLRNK